MRTGYKIGEFAFCIDTYETLNFPENMSCFRVPTEDFMYSYRLTVTDLFPEPAGMLFVDKGNLQVYHNNGRESRYLRLKGSNTLYGFCREVSECESEILFAKDMLDYLPLDPVFVSLLSLERHILKSESFVLHCAYIENQGEAILFSAPSETGKTTQANLWNQYKRTRTINGDRSLLRKINGIWHACGWPVCGTSGVCINSNYPIKAIIVLSQAKENHVEKMTGIKAFSKIYSQLMINRWDTSAHQKAMDLLQSLISDIPVYHLACTISEEAVNSLENVLYHIE